MMMNEDDKMKTGSANPGGLDRVSKESPNGEQQHQRYERLSPEKSAKTRLSISHIK
jgi:hypothetical protein